MRKTELNDQALCEAVVEMARGLIDADLGGGVVKKRVPLDLLRLSSKELAAHVESEALQEICHDCQG